MSQLQVTGEAKIRDIQGPVVANNGVVTALDGAASQYVRGDGTLADFPTSSGGGSSVSYYLNSSVSQGTIGGVAYRQLSKEPIIGAGTDITISANGYVANYLTDANDPDVILVPGGNFNCEFYFSVNNNTGNPTFYAELYKYDGTTFTLLGSSVGVPESINQGTTIAPYYFAIPVATATLALTDRLAIRIYVNVDGRTVTLHTENSHLCQVVTTLSKGMVSLNNLTDQSQFITTGTSGTDFNIVSSGDTHTFNIPSASASNRGLITTGTQTIAGQKTFNATLFGTDAEFSGSILSPIVAILDNTTYTKVVRLQTTAATNRDVYFPDLNGTVALLEGTQTFSGAKTFSTFPTTFDAESIFNLGFQIKKITTGVSASAGYMAMYSPVGTANKIAFLDGDSTRVSTLTFDTTGSFSYTFPALNGTLALLEGTQTFTGDKTFSGDILATNYYRVQQNATLGVAPSGYSTIGAINTKLNFGVGVAVSTQKVFQFETSGLTNNTTRVYTLPDASGTLALTSDLGNYVTLATTQTITGAKTIDNSINIRDFVLINGDGGSTNGGLAIKQYASAVAASTGYTSLFARTSQLGINYGAAFNTFIDGSGLTANRTLTIPDASGTIALTSNLSSYVPYTGATSDVNLGTTYSLSANNITAAGVVKSDFGLQLKSGLTTTISGYLSISAQKVSTNSQLNVYTDTGFYFSLIAPNTANYSYTYPASSGTIVLGTGTTNYLPKFTGASTIGNSQIQDDGTSVGIGGSPNASYKLAVTGASLFSSSVTATQGKFSGSRPQGIFTENGTSGLYLRDASGSSYKSWSIGTNDIVVGFAITPSTAAGGTTFSTPSFVINESGNVGIGSTNPQMPLTIQANTGNGAIRLIGTSNASSNNAGIYWYNSDNSTFNGYLGNFSTSFDIYNQRSTPMAFYTNGTERMRITSGGNVGIGTSSPAAPLDLWKSGGTAGLLASFTDGTYSNLQITTTTTPGTLVTTTVSSYLAFGTANAERMRITSGGQVIAPYGYQSFKGSVSIGAGATTTIYTVPASQSGDGVYYVYCRLNGGSQIYMASAIVTALGSNGEIFISNTRTGSNVGLSVSGNNIRITNGGFGTFTWQWSILFQPVD